MAFFMGLLKELCKNESKIYMLVGSRFIGNPNVIFYSIDKLCIQLFVPSTRRIFPE